MAENVSSFEIKEISKKYEDYIFKLGTELGSKVGDSDLQKRHREFKLDLLNIKHCYRTD